MKGRMFPLLWDDPTTLSEAIDNYCSDLDYAILDCFADNPEYQKSLAEYHRLAAEKFGISRREFAAHCALHGGGKYHRVVDNGDGTVLVVWNRSLDYTFGATEDAPAPNVDRNWNRWRFPLPESQWPKGTVRVWWETGSYHERFLMAAIQIPFEWLPEVIDAADIAAKELE